MWRAHLAFLGGSRVHAGRERVLRRRKDFARCYARGRVWKNRLAVLHVATNDTGLSRVGFTVSRKLGNAVERNRVRRWLREIFRELYDDMRPGHDIVAAARVRAKIEGYWALRSAIAQLLTRSRALAGPDRPDQRGMGR